MQEYPASPLVAIDFDDQFRFQRRRYYGVAYDTMIRTDLGQNEAVIAGQ